MKKKLLPLKQCIKLLSLLFLSNSLVTDTAAQTNGDIRSRFNTAAGSIGSSGNNWEIYNSTTGLWTNVSTNPSLVASGNTCTIRDGFFQTANGNTTLAGKIVVGDGNAVAATVTVSGGSVTGITITNPGKITSLVPISAIFLSSVATTVATASLNTFKVADYEITNPGTGYTSAPTVTIGTVWAGGAVVAVNNQRANGGNVYTCTTAGTTDVSGGPTGTGTGIVDGTAVWSYAGVQATATATVGDVTLGATTYTNGISSLTITNEGSGYNGYPGISFSGGGGASAAARCKLGALSATVTAGGVGYTTAPEVIFGSVYQVGNNSTTRTNTFNGGLEFKAGARLFNVVTENIILASDLTLATDISAFTPQLSTHTASTNFTCTKAGGTVNINGPGKLLAKAFTVTSGISALNIASNGTVSVASGSTANFNSQSVVVQSSASSSGKIIINGTLSNASNVTLQQWVTGQRGYRVLSNPFNSALTPSTVGTANGITITGASDVKTYNGVANAWTGSVSSIAANTPYSVFIRGLASEVTGLSYTAGPTAFAYGVTGTLNGSSVTLNQNNSTETDWTIAGNPFAAPVNSSALTGGTANTPYYIYSMGQNNTGARIKAGGWVAAGSNSSTTTPIPMMGTVAYQAGTGAPATFDVLNSAINTTDAAQTGLFGQGDATTQLELQVAKDGVYQDKLFVRFNANSSALGKERMDLPKLNNDVTNIYTLTSDNTRLAVDARKGIDATIPIGITSPVGKYTFTVASNNFVNASNVYLIDKVANTKTALESGATYSFEITADAATQGDNRFELGTVKTAINETIVRESFAVKVLGAVVNNAVTVQVKGAKSSSVQITVVDMQGKIISNTTSSSTINNVKLASGSGMYMIKVTDGDNTIVSKVVKP